MIQAGRKRVTGEENIKYKHVAGSLLSMQLRDHDQCKRILYLQGGGNRKVAFTAFPNICAIHKSPSPKIPTLEPTQKPLTTKPLLIAL